MERAQRTQEIADRILAATEGAALIDPISEADPSFGRGDAHDVLAAIEASRRRAGWRSVGRKIGFTNRTIWELYGVDGPLWAHLWDRTVVHAPDGRATLSLAPFVQPRIEPEVVLGIDGPVPPTADAADVLERVRWIAAGFEVVQCHFPGWRFTLADATADLGLHGALVVGPPLAVDDADRERLAEALATFEATLVRDGEAVARGSGANVLGSPALAVAELARVLDEHHPEAPLSAGEVLTTGTLTDAWPISPGETWSSDYGDLGIEGLSLTLS